MGRLHIATAGWTIPRAVAEAFPAEGAGLTRYSGRFDGVEINSTFYRSHRSDTYARWVAATPGNFRFALKLPRAITHEGRLTRTDELAGFRDEALQLGEKLGPLLVQLPPSLVFDSSVADPFFAGLRALWPEPIACEPRHVSWFEPEADALLRSHRAARVAADPARAPNAGEPGGWLGLGYWRLHGSPRMYYSAYGEDDLQRVAGQIRAHPAQELWCVFDNTTSGAAAANALRLSEILCDDP